ncbi:MAG: tol-pal system protein YbgF [Rhodospirillales bacterium]|nr:tol-pal system protein YbgF [Rhodospirillales bacterium]
MAPPATARLDVRMTQLEQDMRSLTGRLEEVTYQLRKLDERLSKFASDTEFRFSQLQPAEADTAKGGGTPVAAPSAPPAGAATSSSETRTPAPASAPRSPREQYAQAFTLMQNRNYPDAAAGFSAFLSANPDDPLADNARYWLGETYYARGDYAKAAETFLDGYEKNKTSAKAPDTLLKLGMSLAGLDKPKEACASFRELKRAFPNASDAVKQRAEQESKRINCT